ncbi:MAG TPA: cytochrome c-type biogenesis protein CcmH [Chloroflexota bacterium]|jgi:cytochrome c-type biogenesis protein CcmH|nr:cytochrome c-type biogenesis protein CcmH [Chloroflexota bacterium]
MISASKNLRSILLLAAIVVTGAIVLLVWGAQPGRPTLDDRVRAVSAELRCPVCQGESVYDSPSGLAQSMRTIIRHRLKAGQSQTQIRSYFVSRYGDWILLSPPAAGIGAVVWFGPPVVVGLGLVVLVLVGASWIRRRDPARASVLAEAPTDRDEATFALDQLARMRAQGDLTAEQFDVERGRITASARGENDRTRTPAPPVTRRSWVQLSVMLGAAVAIAVSIFVAVQPRGSVAGSTSPSQVTLTFKGPADLVAAEKLVAEHPRQAWAWATLGARSLAHGDAHGARLAFEYTLKLHRLNATAAFALAYLDVGQGKSAQAVSVLAPLARNGATSARFWLLEGLARARLAGGRTAAIGDFRRFLSLSPHGALDVSVTQWIDDLAHGRAAP